MMPKRMICCADSMPSPKPTPKPIVATINDSAILTHKIIRDRGIGKKLARGIVVSCFGLETFLEE
jgi:hypothetical protein